MRVFVASLTALIFSRQAGMKQRKEQDSQTGLSDPCRQLSNRAVE
jgi:hypothetical protein